LVTPLSPLRVPVRDNLFPFQFLSTRVIAKCCFPKSLTSHFISHSAFLTVDEYQIVIASPTRGGSLNHSRFLVDTNCCGFSLGGEEQCKSPFAAWRTGTRGDHLVTRASPSDLVIELSSTKIISTDRTHSDMRAHGCAAHLDLRRLREKLESVRPGDKIPPKEDSLDAESRVNSLRQDPQ